MSDEPTEGAIKAEQNRLDFLKSMDEYLDALDERDEAVARAERAEAKIAELEAENRLLRARPMHKRPDFRDGIPSDEE